MKLPAAFGPEYRLLWPKGVFAQEAREVAGSDDRGTRLLEEAFAGQEPLDDFRASASPAAWGTPNEETGSFKFLHHLADNVERLPEAPAPYWNVKQQGHQRTQSKLSFEELQDRWRRLVGVMQDDGYLARTAPPECVDGDPVDPDETIRSEIHTRTGLAVTWPQRRGATLLDEDTFYTVVEVIHDLVARPRVRSYHDYGDCGWHYSNFSIRTGQALYRAKVNTLFQDAHVALQLAESGTDIGRLVRTEVDERQKLVEEAIDRANSGGNRAAADGDDILHAIEQFRSRGASRQDKKLACVSLAGVLERRRRELKLELLTKDEGALFQIANGFALRHQRADQKPDYRDDYLAWVFWIYLATIELTDRLASRPSSPKSNPA